MALVLLSVSTSRGFFLMSEIVQNNQPAEERRFSGLAASPGIGIGKAFVHGGITVEPETYEVGQEDVEGEIARMEVALADTRKQIEQLQEQVGRTSNGHREASIFDAHLLMLEDRSVLDEVISIVREERLNIESAFYRTINNYIAVLRVSDDVYLRQRVIDFEDVMRRILRKIATDETDTIGDTSTLADPDVVDQLIANK